MTEEKMLSRLKRGKTDALEALIDQYNGYVSSIVTYIIGTSGTQQDVEELVSDVFFSIWNHANALKPGKVKPYIGAAARNRAKSFLRANRELPMDPDELPLPVGDNTENTLLLKEQQQYLYKAISNLPPPDKEIFLRYYYYFQSSVDIARELDMTPGTVRTHLMRGRNKLKEKLIQEDVL